MKHKIMEQKCMQLQTVQNFYTICNIPVNKDLYYFYLGSIQADWSDSGA